MPPMAARSRWMVAARSSAPDPACESRRAEAEPEASGPGRPGAEPASVAEERAAAEPVAAKCSVSVPAVERTGRFSAGSAQPPSWNQPSRAATTCLQPVRTGQEQKDWNGAACGKRVRGKTTDWE